MSLLEEPDAPVPVECFFVCFLVVCFFVVVVDVSLDDGEADVSDVLPLTPVEPLVSDEPVDDPLVPVELLVSDEPPDDPLMPEDEPLEPEPLMPEDPEELSELPLEPEPLMPDAEPLLPVPVPLVELGLEPLLVDPPMPPEPLAPVPVDELEPVPIEPLEDGELEDEPLGEDDEPLAPWSLLPEAPFDMMSRFWTFRVSPAPEKLARTWSPSFTSSIEAREPSRITCVLESTFSFLSVPDSVSVLLERSKFSTLPLSVST